jgi:hypothetical protein
MPEISIDTVIEVGVADTKAGTVGGPLGGTPPGVFVMNVAEVLCVLPTLLVATLRT